MKHWQIFALTVGIIFIFQLFFILRLLLTDHFLNGIIYYYILFLLFPFVILVLWYYAMGISINSLLPEHLKKKALFFKITSFFPLIYFLLVFLIFGIILGKSSVDIDPLFIFILILPAHLFSMFCIFYLFYFCSKSLKTYELQKKVKFVDFATEFILLWFSPIGIWIIQPRINKIYEANNHLIK